MRRKYAKESNCTVYCLLLFTNRLKECKKHLIIKRVIQSVEYFPYSLFVSLSRRVLSVAIPKYFFILSGAAFFHLKACNGGLESCIVIKSDFVGEIVVYGVIVVVISCFATTDQGSSQFMVGLGIVKLIPSTLLWWIGTGATAMMRMLWVF